MNTAAAAVVLLGNHAHRQHVGTPRTTRMTALVQPRFGDSTEVLQQVGQVQRPALPDDAFVALAGRTLHIANPEMRR